MNKESIRLLQQSISELNNWKDSFGDWEYHPSMQPGEDKLAEVFSALTQKLKCNYPFHHPVYAGQMLKPPHPAAWAAYALAMSVNPNNHALDGGPPSSEMEKEVMAEMARFFGYGDEYLGHLTSSGTIANLEALWVSRELNPGKKVIYSHNAHYTHGRMCAVLGVESQAVKFSEEGIPDTGETDISEIGTVVVTLGTTGLGEVEPLAGVLAWAREHQIRVHVDAAYGGFFRVLRNSGMIDGRHWEVMSEADSIVVDPHKHGLQPYGCGCVLFKDPAVGRFYKHDSPYTYFSSDDLHLGEISLECSRSGAAAVAFWATLQLLPLKEKEGFGPVLKACRNAALNMKEELDQSGNFKVYQTPDLDILAYFPVTGSKELKASVISEQSSALFRKGMAGQDFYLSLYKVPSEAMKVRFPELIADLDQVTILRSVFMKPEQENFAAELRTRLDKAVSSL